MAIESTKTLSPLYILEAPDWSKGVELERMFSTTLQTSRTGIEQRASNWIFPRFRMRYVVAALSPSEHRLRRVRAESECRSPLLVPFWPLRYGVTSINGSILKTDQDGSHDFHPTQWVYIIENGSGSVIPIQDVNGRDITVKAGYSWGSYTAAASLYPVLRCVRTQQDPIFSASHVRGVDEQITVETL